MKGKIKKLLVAIVAIIAVVILAVIFVFKYDLKNENAISLSENQWIDNNKQNVIDVALFNDISTLSYEGEGLVYDFFDNVSKELSLKFNFITYKIDDNIEYDYKMDVVDKVGKNQIKILEDNMILLTIDNAFYSDINEIQNLKIGVLKNEKEAISNYLNQTSITYVEYDNYGSLKNAITTSKDSKKEGNTDYEVDAIVVLKNLFTKEIVENNFTNAYTFNDLNRYFVLSIEKNDELYNILNKKFNIWKLENFETKYNEYLLNNYYKFKGLTDVEQKTLKSKNYVYGFINYGVYNYLEGNKISGINSIILKQFNKFSGLSITYTRYNSISKLVSDFDAGKVDFMFNVINKDKITKDYLESKQILSQKLFVVSDVNNKQKIDNLKSLKDKSVLVVKDSYIEKYLIDNEIKCKSYNNLEEVVKDFKENDFILIDSENYNFYKTTGLKNAKIDYISNESNLYNYIIKDHKSNKTFSDIFNFYLSYGSLENKISNGYGDIIRKNIDVIFVLSIIVIILSIYVLVDFSSHLKVMFKSIKKSKKINLSKEEKIKYIDQLTSLKNRNYLNSKIEIWDDSEVYPQAIIVIDLNNVAYINDNYGREEGDKVITEAANILIQHQLANSEIIRTDGNEFLIYLVGYSEKQIISYLRKLSKEFKNLSHGFGAASGYSIIKDAIKTIDDAVNEATLSMKENKEDIDY